MNTYFKTIFIIIPLVALVAGCNSDLEEEVLLLRVTWMPH